LAEVRVKEAEALLAAGLWDGAYYLAGYAVECGLKACIAKLTKAEDFPPKEKIVRDYYSHELGKLLDIAGLTSEVKSVQRNPPMKPNVAVKWQVIEGWSEQSRYERTVQKKAEVLIAAITDPTDGVLPWIKTHW
jgi:hypothetical protein